MSDLSSDQVKFLLSLQGYVVPETDLIEITASLNALIEGLSDMEQYGALDNEPWPTLVQYGGADA